MNSAIVLAEKIGMTRVAFAWSQRENLEKPGLVIETREVERAKMHKLNLKHPL